MDGQRFAGACYRAANWIPLGQTQGRGRMDRHHQADGSAGNLVFVYPLCRHVQQRLREAQAPCFSEAEADTNCRTFPKTSGPCSQLAVKQGRELSGKWSALHAGAETRQSAHKGA